MAITRAIVIVAAAGNVAWRSSPGVAPPRPSLPRHPQRVEGRWYPGRGGGQRAAHNLTKSAPNNATKKVSVELAPTLQLYNCMVGSIAHHTFAFASTTGGLAPLAEKHRCICH